MVSVGVKYHTYLLFIMTKYNIHLFQIFFEQITLENIVCCCLLVCLFVGWLVGWLVGFCWFVRFVFAICLLRLAVRSIIPEYVPLEECIIMYLVFFRMLDESYWW